MADQNQSQQKTLRDFLYILFRFKWLIVTIFFVVIIPTFLVLLFKADMYQSNAKILVTSGQTDPLEMATGMSVSSEMDAELELLRSRGFAEAVVDKSGYEEILANVEEGSISLLLNEIGIASMLDKPESHEEQDPAKLRETAIRILQETLTIGNAPRSNVVNLRYYATSPTAAQSILEMILDTYMDKHIEMHTAQLSLDFLSEETEAVQRELAKSESELRRFQEEVNIMSLEEQRTLLLTRLDTTDLAIQETEANIHATEAVIERVKTNIEARTQLREQEVLLESHVARLQILRRQRRTVQRELERFRSNEQVYYTLRRDIELLNEKYRRYQESLEQARIAQTLENQRISNIGILQKPTFIIQPINREKRKTFALGLFLALAGSIGMAFLVEYLNHKIKSVEEIKKELAINNVVAIPFIDVKKIARNLKKQEHESGQHPIIDIQRMAEHITVWLYLSKEVRDCFEVIKNQLQKEILQSDKKGPGKAPFVLGVTSSYRGEGVSSVATGIAYVIALTENENVLLVDSNSHHPHEEKIIGANRPPGLFEITVKRDTAVQDDVDKNPFPSMDAMDDMKGYFDRVDGSEKIDRMMPSVVKQNYNAIVLDLPAIDEGVAALKSASVADGVVLVIESQRVRREVIKHIKEKLRDEGAKIFYVVFNKRQFYIPKWLYNKV